ncbi:MAG: hypothetical protein AAGA54_16330 [Myxococcota bacterium]
MSGRRAAAWLGGAALLVVAGLAFGWGDDGRDGPWLHTLQHADDATEQWASDVRAHWKQRAPIAGWPRDGVTQRYETCLRADAPRRLRLRLGADDAVSLRVADVTLQQRREAADYAETVNDVKVPAGVVPIVVTSRDLEGAHSVQLWVENDDGGRQQLPMRWLQRPPCG